MKKILLIFIVLALVLIAGTLGITASQRRLTVNTGRIDQLTHQTIPLTT
ncbi:hypothetical protein [Levilactobacillus lindianensis]|nr:hypothetical protein [Levilactobacillus lindianensis]